MAEPTTGLAKASDKPPSPKLAVPTTEGIAASPKKPAASIAEAASSAAEAAASEMTSPTETPKVEISPQIQPPASKTLLRGSEINLAAIMLGYGDQIRGGIPSIEWLKAAIIESHIAIMKELDAKTKEEKEYLMEKLKNVNKTGWSVEIKEHEHVKSEFVQSPIDDDMDDIVEERYLKKNPPFIPEVEAKNPWNWSQELLTQQSSSSAAASAALDDLLAPSKKQQSKRPVFVPSGNADDNW